LRVKITHPKVLEFISDEIAEPMLAELLRRRGIATQFLSVAALTAESLRALAKTGGKVVCISSVPPAEVRRARHLSKKVRAPGPGLINRRRVGRTTELE
jgi:hypothetical protein